MEEDPGSVSSTSQIEEPLGGGRPPISDSREGDRESETSQDLNTTTEQVVGSKGTDDSNMATGVSGLQMTGANEDAYSKEEHASEQGRPPLVDHSTGNADNQQASEDWLIVNHENSDAGTAGKGEARTRMERDDAVTVVKGEACAQMKEYDAVPVGKGEACTQVKTAVDTDETTSQKSLKNDPVVAKVGGTEGSCAAAADEVGAEVRTLGSCESSEVLEPSSTGVSDSRPQKEAVLYVELSGTVSESEPRNEAFTSPEPAGKMTGSEAQEKSSEVPEPSSTGVSDSRPQKEAVLCVELSGTVSESESRNEAFTSPEPAGKMTGSEAQEKSSEVTEPSSTGMSDSRPQKEAVLCVELSGTVSESESRNEAFTSPEPAGKMTGSEAQGGSSVRFGASCSVLASGALDVVPNPVVQEDVRRFSEAFSTSEVKEDSVETKALTMASIGEVPKDVSSISSDSPNTVGASEGIRKCSSTDSAVRNEVSTSADPPSSIVEGEVSVVSKAPSTASASEAQKSFGISPEAIVPGVEVPRKVSALESSRRTVSQAGESRIAGGETSVPEGDTAVGDPFLTTNVFIYEEQLATKDEELAQKNIDLAEKDKTIAELRKTLARKENLLSINKGKYQALEQNCDGWAREREGLARKNAELGMAYSKNRTELEKYEIAYARMLRTFGEQDRLIRDLRGQLEQKKKECGTLQDQMSLYEQQHANEQSRGGSYLDDTKAATPALLVSSLNGVKDASNNFVKVLKSSIQSGIEQDVLQEYIGAVSRSGHSKFQYQAYICRVLFDGFELPHTGLSKSVLPPTTYFRQYQLHDLKKTDTVDRLLRCDPEIDPSLHEFCFDKFYNLMNDMQHLLIDKSVDLRQLVHSKQHARESKLYVSFCKLAVSVWLLQRLAFSFLHPAKLFIAQRGALFDLNRMQSVVPLDEPSADDEVQLKVGFYVLPGFDVGNSAIPCEVYVAMK